jgi:hypothetical protein
MKDKISGF